MTMSLPSDEPPSRKSNDTASARTARSMRLEMFTEELEKSARVRAEAGIVPTEAGPEESEEATLARWAWVAGR